jgi:hypothetical protein
MPFFAIRPSLFAIQFFSIWLCSAFMRTCRLLRPSVSAELLRKETTIMRRSIQLDRTEALPVKTIHRSGLVYSARYR